MMWSKKERDHSKTASANGWGEPYNPYVKPREPVSDGYESEEPKLPWGQLSLDDEPTRAEGLDVLDKLDETLDTELKAAMKLLEKNIEIIKLESECFKLHCEVGGMSKALSDRHKMLRLQAQAVHEAFKQVEAQIAKARSQCDVVQQSMLEW